MPKDQNPRSHPAPAVSPSKPKGNKKPTLGAEDRSLHPPKKCNARNRAENSGDWPFRVPREVMDLIMADSSLGIREHLALAATCASLRRCYHHNDVWRDIRQMRCVPKNGSQITLDPGLYYRREPDSRRMLHLATSPQKKKANGSFFMALSEPYALHRKSVGDCWRHRITAQKAKELYPLVTDEHLARLRYFERDHRGYFNQWTEEGYAEVCVEWMFYRIKAGLELTPKIEEVD